MAASEPRAKNLADLYDLAPLDWADVRRTLETNLTQEPGTGGPGHHTLWLSTIDADGRPHMTAVGAFWVVGHSMARELGRVDAFLGGFDWHVKFLIRSGLAIGSGAGTPSQTSG